MLDKEKVMRAFYAVKQAQENASYVWVACGDGYQTKPRYIAALDACAKAWESAAIAVGKDHDDYWSFFCAAEDWRLSLFHPDSEAFKQSWTRLLKVIQDTRVKSEGQ